MYPNNCPFLHFLLGIDSNSSEFERKLNPWESTPKGVQTQRRRVFDNKNRKLRGQKGMVGAGESSLLHNTGKSSSLWPPSCA